MNQLPLQSSINMRDLKPGFVDPVLDSQAAFRTLMEAVAYAGRIRVLPPQLDAPPPLHPATAAACLTLMDFETPVWLDPAAATPAVINYVRFHCGAPVVTNPSAARFAVVTDPDAMPDLGAFHPGEDAYPDRSCTVVVQVDALPAAPGAAGPGRASTAPWWRRSTVCRAASGTRGNATTPVIPWAWT